MWGGEEIREAVGQSKALTASERSSSVIGSGDTVIWLCSPYSCKFSVVSKGTSGAHPSSSWPAVQFTGHDHVSPLKSIEMRSHPWALCKWLSVIFYSHLQGSFMGTGTASRVPSL